MLKSFLTDPLLRRFISAAFFASAFIWVAVAFFDVETEVVKVLFVYSIGFVAIMVVVGLLIFPIIRIFRQKPSSLLDGSMMEHAKDEETAGDLSLGNADSSEAGTTKTN
ncbi:MAG: hypothetical protein VB957_13160 [Pseudomonadales bacterium]